MEGWEGVRVGGLVEVQNVNCSALLLQTLQQKEREENEKKIKLQNAQAVLLSRLAELGAGSYVAPASLSPKSSPNKTPTTSSVGTNTSPPPSRFLGPKTKVQRSSSPKSPLRLPDQTVEEEEDESIVIDVLSQESEDDISSTTSGSDGGCTSTSHKYEIPV